MHKNLVRLGRAVFELFERAIKQTDRQRIFYARLHAVYVYGRVQLVYMLTTEIGLPLIMASIRQGKRGWIYQTSPPGAQLGMRKYFRFLSISKMWLESPLVCLSCSVAA